MVSMAGGIALSGGLPVVNSFASFLASRANEQIYNNATEETKIIYVLHYAGLIPAGPGKSHQSLRDISLLAALPNCIILQPCNGLETRMITEYCVKNANENCAIRLIIGPSPSTIELPSGYNLKFGQGVALSDGDQAIVFAYGPTMLHEALLTREILMTKGISLMVVNMPWLNRFDEKWLLNVISRFEWVFVLEDHSINGALGDHMLSTLMSHPSEPLKDRRLIKFGVEGWPAFGSKDEVMNYHGLDGTSLAKRIMKFLSTP